MSPWMRRKWLHQEPAVHDALYGVAFTARNSHQINTRLPDWQSNSLHNELHLAKECVGSDRDEKNDRNFP